MVASVSKTEPIETEPIFELDPIVIQLTDEQFEELCRNNRDLRFEQTAAGDLIIMPPTGWETGNRNSEMTYQVQAWSRKIKTGKAFDSSTGFILPNGAKRSPDASWVSQVRLDALNPNPDKFLPLAPDFAIELRSKSDNLRTVRQKMLEYMAVGVRLGWLINPQDKQVEIYRLNQPVEILQSPEQLSGEAVLPGFVLELKEIWG
jgi:Uma2 family endonuclease